MGLDLIYSCDGHEFDIRFTMADWETIEQLRQYLPEAVASMVDVPELGDAVRVPLNELRDAIENIDNFLRDRLELLPFTFQFKFEYILGSDGNPLIHGDAFSTGGLSGIRLPEDDRLSRNSPPP